MEFFIKDDVLNIISSSKTTVYFDFCGTEIKIDDLSVSFPGEYEKGGILLEVKEYEGLLFYSFTIDGKHVLIIPSDKFELKEEILSFFGDVDILVILGTKESIEIFESIEARVVIPFGPTKDVFLLSSGQKIEEVKSYKIRGELPENTSEFINLVETQ